ncbi:hypothetical protein DER44DRAFT_850633 [Fusarium oxysporum]|nr:hypothetical protein DER44DRAFT_850633 [Fusarium oxysporum]
MHLPRLDQAHASMAHRSLEGASRSVEICAVLATFSVLSTITVALRTYIRLVLLRTFGLDDGLMVVAQILAIGSAIAIGLENKYGLGYHTWEQPKDNYVPYMKAFYASVIVYNIGICFVKIGILLQYRRVFALRLIQIITFYGVMFMIAWTITIAFLNILICVPVAAVWDTTITGRCINRLTVWYVMAGFNLVTDIGIFCIPLPVIKSLQLPRKQKAMLLAIFCLGFFTCIISIIRIQTLRVAASTKDPNWDNVDAAIWSFLEVAIAVIAACLPTLRPLFSKLMPRMFASSSRSTGPPQYGPYVQAPSSQYLNDMKRTRTGKSQRSLSDDTMTLNENSGIPVPTHSYSIKSRLCPVISVSISGGGKQDQPSENIESKDCGGGREAAKGGIQTTTTVIQQVATERISEDGWNNSRRSDSDITL